jgi:hypothetical protein
MPAELDSPSATFTEEAEVALRRALMRLERQLRGAAMDDAVRQRGLPAEVTGSDVERAFMRTRRATRQLAPADTEQWWDDWNRTFRNQESGTRPGRLQTDVRFPMSQRLATAYIWGGLLLAVCGVLYPPLYHRFKELAIDPTWRFGLVLSATGVATSVIGILVKTMFAKRFRPRSTR